MEGRDEGEDGEWREGMREGMVNGGEGMREGKG